MPSRKTPSSRDAVIFALHNRVSKSSIAAWSGTRVRVHAGNRANAARRCTRGAGAGGLREGAWRDRIENANKHSLLADNRRFAEL